MNLRQLKYFVGVVDAGNMTRAAEQLHVAQTALGMQIRQIEEDLGVSLLVRHSRGVEPTPAGKLLYARAHDILKLVEETHREVAACEGDSVEAIRLGITPALMIASGSDIAVTVRERLPGVSLSMLEAMSHVLVEMLSRGEVDLVLCYDVPDSRNFRVPRSYRTTWFWSHSRTAGTANRSPSPMRSIAILRCRRKGTPCATPFRASPGTSASI